MEVETSLARQTLTPTEAEHLVEQRIQDFGMGALPQISVTEERGQWRITWDGKMRMAPPMNEAAWLSWLEENVGEVAPERLGSLEG